MTRSILRHAGLALVYCGIFAVLAVILVYSSILEKTPDLRPWHQAKLDVEFTASDAESVSDLRGYLAVEDRLFTQLHREVYDRLRPEDRRVFNRFTAGSLSDPERGEPNWNRTFELPVDNPRAGILLLHGLSDSPYTWRALAQLLHSQGVWVLAMRMPGHGTAPSGLVFAKWQDAAAAVRIGARRIRKQLGPDRPFYIGGYSTGAPLAVDYTLAVLEGEDLPRPDGLLLLSPAIGVSKTAALAVWQSRIGGWLGLDKLAWISVQPEFDPYKYNSFAVNAGDQVYRLTEEINERLDGLDDGSGAKGLPRVLAFMSVSDFTIPPETLIDRLFHRLAPEGHELVLFDINRHSEAEPLFVPQPERLTQALLPDPELPFGLTLITNVDPETDAVHALHKAPFSSEVVTEPLDLAWPGSVYSLSHVAIPFRPDDPVYGERDSADELNLGRVELRGERGLLSVPIDQLTRLRFNPFYSYLAARVLEFMSGTGERGRRIPPRTGTHQ